MSGHLLFSTAAVAFSLLLLDSTYWLSTPKLTHYIRQSKDVD